MTPPKKKRRPTTKDTQLRKQAAKRRTDRHKSIEALKDFLKDRRAELRSQALDELPATPNRGLY